MKICLLLKVWGDMTQLQQSLLVLQPMNPCSVLSLSFLRMKNGEKHRQTNKKRGICFSVFIFFFFFFFFSLQKWNCFIKELLERNHLNFSSLFGKAEQWGDYSEEWDDSLPALITSKSSSVSASLLCSFHGEQSFTHFTSPPGLSSCQESLRAECSQASSAKWMFKAVF